MIPALKIQRRSTPPPFTPRLDNIIPFPLPLTQRVSNPHQRLPIIAIPAFHPIIRVEIPTRVAVPHTPTLITTPAFLYVALVGEAGVVGRSAGLVEGVAGVVGGGRSLALAIDAFVGEGGVGLGGGAGGA